MFIIFLTAEKFWNHFLLVCKVDVVDYVVEGSDAGIDDSSVERWLILCWKPCRNFGRRNSRWKEELHIFVDEVLLRRRRGNPCKSSLSQKFFLFRASFFKWRQNLLLYHMYHFLKSMRTKSTRALSFSSYSILGTSILQGRMTSWDWSLRRQHWKLFKWSFHGWRWSRRRCASRILIVE